MGNIFKEDIPTSNRRNFDTWVIEILGELSYLCKEKSIEFTNLESFYCIQGNNSTSTNEARSKEDIKVKEGIDLLTKMELEGMKFFVCWTCKEFGHFSSKCPKRLRKTKKS